MFWNTKTEIADGRKHKFLQKCCQNIQRKNENIDFGDALRIAYTCIKQDKEEKLSMRNEKKKIKDFWWFHNDTCWKIKREGMVDFYLYLPTMRYIYKSSVDNIWRGTKNPSPAITLSKTERDKIKKFESEDVAVKWLSGERYR